MSEPTDTLNQTTTPQANLSSQSHTPHQALLTDILLNALTQFLPNTIEENTLAKLPPRELQALDEAHISIIISYRDRKAHLDTLIPKLKTQLLSSNIAHDIVIVEQDDQALFNRGFLHNVGAAYCQKFTDGFVFHDVDFVPVNIDYRLYNFALRPFCKVTGAKSYTIPWYNRPSAESVLDSAEVKAGTLYPVYDNFFGGVTSIPKKLYEQINGFTNALQGWGLEDQDLLIRLKKYGAITASLDQGHFHTLAHAHALSTLESPEEREELYNRNRQYFREQCTRPFATHIENGLSSMPPHTVRTTKLDDYTHLSVKRVV